MGKNYTSFILFLSIGSTVFAQKETILDSEIVKSIDAIVHVTYDILSGKEGRIQDWKRLRSFYLPNARFTILNHPEDSISLQYESLSLDEFIDYMNENNEYYEKGFIQYELGKVVNTYNGIANVFQSFYAKDSEGGEGRGVASYQLLYFNQRWWISDVLWTTETKDVTIPNKYLRDKE